MAHFKNLEDDWFMLCQQGTDCWTQSDLQLAAELGKTLLERNKELENSLKVHQTTIEEQAQEIEHMKKHTAALKEVNNTRLNIYEQLEVSIHDLERANRRLVIENSSDKKLIKSQSLTIENLETKCEELQKKIDELKSRYESLQRQQSTAIQTTQNSEQQPQLATWKTSISKDCSIQQIAARSPLKSVRDAPVDTCSRQQLATPLLDDDEEVTELLRQLHESRNQRAREQKRVAELSEQLATLLQENSSLEDQLSLSRNKAQDMKNLQDEINTLEEVRQGHLCGRCLRGVDLSTHDELSVMLDQEEDDDISMAESFVNDTVRERDSDSTMQESSNKAADLEESNDPNPYRVLVEKYEALLEVQRHPAIRRKPSIPTACMSLQEELEMSGEFNTFQTAQLDEDQLQENGKIANGRRGFGKKPFSATPTDFSEAETSSSGFSDETSNKSTQTDGRPGSFLCSIADGEDCKFSIYDDNSPFESRFRKTPEYRQLFSEIFGVLKRAAEAKDEGEKLPLIDNSANASSDLVHPDSLQDDLNNSDTTDDCQSVMSSVISSVVSEPVFRVHTPTPNDRSLNDSLSSSRIRHSSPRKIDALSNLSNGNKIGNDNHPRYNQPRRHHHHHHLDYLSVNVQVRKKNAAKRNTPKKMIQNEVQRSVTPDIAATTSPKINASKSSTGGRRKFRPLTTAEQADGAVWNGNTLHIFSSKNKSTPNTNRSKYHNGSNSRNSSYEQHHSSFEYKEYKPSTASEEVARLRRLEMSYAEALRMPNKPKAHNNRTH